MTFVNCSWHFFCVLSSFQKEYQYFVGFFTQYYCYHHHHHHLVFMVWMKNQICGVVNTCQIFRVAHPNISLFLLLRARVFCSFIFDSPSGIGIVIRFVEAIDEKYTNLSIRKTSTSHEMCPVIGINMWIFVCTHIIAEIRIIIAHNFSNQNTNCIERIKLSFTVSIMTSKKKKCYIENCKLNKSMSPKIRF